MNDLSVSPDDFRPAWWARGPHCQTTWGRLARPRRLVGFRRDFAEPDARPALSPDSAQRLAEHVLSAWLGEPLARWRMVTSSYETRKTSGRIDRTWTFERSDRRIGDAPIRMNVVIAGDTPSAARLYVVVPESFRHRQERDRVAPFGAAEIEVAFVERGHDDRGRKALEHLPNHAGGVPVVRELSLNEGRLRAQPHGLGDRHA
mgnify:CR=1 FL=1